MWEFGTATRATGAVVLVAGLLVGGFLGVGALTDRLNKNNLSAEEYASSKASFDAEVEAQRKQNAADERERLAAAREAVTLRIRRPVGRPLNVLFAGDSLVVGIGATTEADGFRAEVLRTLREGGPVEETLAYSKKDGEYYRASNLTGFGKSQDLAIVEIGTNDLSVIDTDEFRRDFTAMLDKIEADSPGVGFLCMGVWRGTGGVAANESAFNAVIREECEGRGGEYIPVAAYITAANTGPEGRRTWRGAGDTFHPNDEGHDALAQAILDQLKVSPS